MTYLSHRASKCQSRFKTWSFWFPKCKYVHFYEAIITMLTLIVLINQVLLIIYYLLLIICCLLYRLQKHISSALKEHIAYLGSWNEHTQNKTNKILHDMKCYMVWTLRSASISKAMWTGSCQNALHNVRVNFRRIWIKSMG